MVQWPIRIKLIAGLVLVVGMMLILMGGSLFGLHAFHSSNLTVVDLLPELGAAKDLIRYVSRLDGHRLKASGDLDALDEAAREAQQALVRYFDVLKKNATRGNRADDGLDERKLAFLMDEDLRAILSALHPEEPAEAVLPGTDGYLIENPSMARPSEEAVEGEVDVLARVDRLNESVMQLPDFLHQDLFTVLGLSKRYYESSRVIVWASFVMVTAMLTAMAALLHRWVLYPVRLLQRGVRRVARGSFDYTIDLRTGDEMQALAEAFNDMTARLRVTYEELERQVHERSRQLVRSERLAGVGFLAAGVAHEINNPLASIAFCSEALESRLGPMLTREPDPADAKVVRNYLRMIQEEAFRCKSITEKLLDFSRCGEIQRQRTDLVALVQGVVEMVRHMGKYRGKQVVFSPRESVMAHADAQEIKQVVLNLVVNALDSMEDGGTLKIDMRRNEGMAEMSFLDDGCGMPPEVLENIFEPFFTRRRTGKGTGLGLSITHRIVSQHHGEITATSPGEGRGATFTVRLPTRPDADTPASADHSGQRAA